LDWKFENPPEDYNSEEENGHSRLSAFFLRELCSFPYSEKEVLSQHKLTKKYEIDELKSEIVANLKVRNEPKDLRAFREERGQWRAIKRQKVTSDSSYLLNANLDDDRAEILSLSSYSSIDANFTSAFYDGRQLFIV
jgi:hypothetical protein